MAVPVNPSTSTNPGGVRSNVLIDIWRGVNISNLVPTGSPDVSQVPGLLQPSMEGTGRGNYAALIRFTHTVTVPLDTDIRDAYNSVQNALTIANADTVVVYDSQDATKKTPFAVMWVEVVGRGTANVVKKAYLDRFQPSTWSGPIDSL